MNKITFFFLFIILSATCAAQQVIYNIPNQPSKVNFNMPSYYLATQGQPITIGGNITGGSAPLQYLWTPSTYLDNAAISNPVCTPQTDITYTIAVTDANQCTYTQDVLVTFTIPSGFKDLKNNSKITIASNPTIGTLNINVQWYKAEHFTFLIINTSGQIIQTFSHNEADNDFNVQQNISTLAPGNYFLQAVTATHKTSTAFIVNK